MIMERGVYILKLKNREDYYGVEIINKFNNLFIILQIINKYVW